MPVMAPSRTSHLGLLDTFRLKMHHLHTGESIDVAYKQGGQYSKMGVAMLNHFLRDHRTQDPFGAHHGETPGYAARCGAGRGIATP